MKDVPTLIFLALSCPVLFCKPRHTLPHFTKQKHTSYVDLLTSYTPNSDINFAKMD